MGSATKRKSNDQPLIRRPKGMAIGSPKDVTEQVADLCKMSFDVYVEAAPFIVKNISVQLEFSGNQHLVYIGGKEIGRLSDKLSSMVSKCEELGVKYRGRIVEDGKNFYARFTRVI